MSDKAHFEKVHDEMEERKRQAMARSSDLKSEVETAINELKKSQISDETAVGLVTRFSEVSHIAGISQSQVEDLIQGFEQLDPKFNASPAVENLKRILQGKNDEKSEFENQSNYR